MWGLARIEKFVDNSYMSYKRALLFSLLDQAVHEVAELDAVGGPPASGNPPIPPAETTDWRRPTDSQSVAGLAADAPRCGRGRPPQLAARPLGQNGSRTPRHGATPTTRARGVGRP